MKTLALTILLSVPGQVLAGEQRIISLMPSYTEILLALGAGKEIVGTIDFCDFPPEAAAIEKVGDYIRPDLEKILSLKPDIVLAGQWKLSTAAQRLRRLGLRVVEIPEERTVEDIYKTVLTIGSACGRKKEALSLAGKMKSGIKAVSSPPQAGRPKVYVEVDSPKWTAGGLSFISDVIAKAGGINIFADIPKPYLQVSWESVIERNPGIMILLSGRARELLKRPGAEKTAAAAANAVIDSLDKNALRPSPRITEAIEKLRAEFKKAEDSRQKKAKECEGKRNAELFLPTIPSLSPLYALRCSWDLGFRAWDFVFDSISQSLNFLISRILNLCQC